MKVIEPLIDARHGKYIPQDFSWLDDWKGISDRCRLILANGPCHKEYWKAWDVALYKARLELDGQTYRLHHNGSLFAIRDPETEEEAAQLRAFLGDESIEVME